MMKSSCRYLNFVCLFMLALCNKSNAQIIADPDDYFHTASIGLVDEFMKRFNGAELHPDISSQDSEAMRKNLYSLFDYERFASKGDSIVNEIDLFIDTVINNSIKLNYEDSDWFAQADCNGSLDGKNVTFTLFLNVKNRGDNMYKWVIDKVEGEIFNIDPRIENSDIMINPDDHETNFISLSRLTKEQPENIKLFMADGFNYDPSSVFAYLVHSGWLKINYVEKLSFIFNQVPGYVFKINKFIRNSNNSGWLISEFTKTRAAESHKPLCVSDSSILNCNIDSVVPMPEELNVVYNRRLAERLGLCKDYLRFISIAKTSDEKNFYVMNLKQLFVNGTMVHIVNSRNEEIEISLSNFLNKLVNRPSYKYNLDYITVPNINSVIKTDEEISAKSLIVPFDDVFNTSKQRQGSQILSIELQDTEDGEEWFTLLGDLFISVKL